MSIKLTQNKRLKDFNRHYNEYNSYVDRDLVYQLLPSELVTMSVISYTRVDFKAYKIHLNTLKD